GFPVPDGFVITTDAYAAAASAASVDPMDPIAARARLLETAVPPEIATAVRDAYRAVGGRVAVRSSATAEDLPEASFAGQQDTILNVRGEDRLIEACHRCFASLWTDRAISYRAARGFDHFDVALSIGVQPMVRSDQACSGGM